MNPTTASAIAHLAFANLASLSLMMIVLVPYITAFMTRAHLPRWANELIAFGVSVVAGIIDFLQAGLTFTSVHNLDTFFAVVAVIFAGAKVYYSRLRVVSPLLTDFKIPKIFQDLGSAYAVGQPTAGTQSEIQGVVISSAATMPLDQMLAVTNHAAQTAALVVQTAQDLSKVQAAAPKTAADIDKTREMLRADIAPPVSVPAPSADSTPATAPTPAAAPPLGDSVALGTIVASVVPAEPPASAEAAPVLIPASVTGGVESVAGDAEPAAAAPSAAPAPVTAPPVTEAPGAPLPEGV